MHISTKAVHSGQKPDPQTGSVIPPIYQTSTYEQPEPGNHPLEYTRYKNPNFENLETALAAMEEGKYATVFSSGLGATTAIISTLNPGDHVILTEDIYGGTFRLFDKVAKRYGVTFETVDMGNLDLVEQAFTKKPALAFIETPTNPQLKITDIKAIAEIAKKHEVLSVIDNTFASPVLQQPLTLGVDAVLHSSSKYIGGHSDIIGGAVITNNADLQEKLFYARYVIGLNPSPFDVWLAHRGLKTLPIRMKKHSENAGVIAKWLQEHPLVSKVYYPGLPEHPNHEIAKRQMSDFGGIISVEFNLELEQMKKLIASFDLFILAESLGGVESLVDHPVTMTHASLPKEEREKAGLKDGLVRFSVGIEDVQDLLEDLERGLSQFV